MLRFQSIIIGLVLSMVGASWAPAREPAPTTLIPRTQHAWGRFQKGAWRRVRVVTESFEENGRLASTTTRETTTLLEDVSATGFALGIQTTVEVAGQRIDKQPQILRQGFSGERQDQKVSITRVGDGEVDINGRQVPCEIRRMVLGGGASKRVIHSYYSASVAPYILKQETTSTDGNGATADYRTRVEVIALDMPHKVLAEIKTTSYIKTIHTNGKSSTITLEVHCDAVPGAVVAHTSKELASSGRLLSRSTLELIDYGIGEDHNAAISKGRNRPFLRRHHPTKSPR